MATVLLTPEYLKQNADHLAAIWAGNIKSERAKRAHVMTDKKDQEKAEGEEARIARELGGKWNRGNEPVDILLESGDSTHGIELKVMRSNTNDKITVGTEPNTADRKKNWARSHGATLHTLVVDKRNGRNDYYYKRGIANSRLGAMQKCKGLDEVKQLVRASEVMSMVIHAAEWEESKHKRAKDGKFGSGGGASKKKESSGKADTKSKKASGTPSRMPGVGEA